MILSHQYFTAAFRVHQKVSVQSFIITSATWGLFLYLVASFTQCASHLMQTRPFFFFQYLNQTFHSAATKSCFIFFAKPWEESHCYHTLIIPSFSPRNLKWKTEVILKRKLYPHEKPWSTSNVRFIIMYCMRDEFSLEIHLKVCIFSYI